MLWSVGKDSTVLVKLCQKAFFGHIPIPHVHIDTGFKIPEMIAYRDRLAVKWKLQMVYGQNEQALKDKKTFPDGNISCIERCKSLKTAALQKTVTGEGKRYIMNFETGKYEVEVNSEPYGGLIVGIRSDEEIACDLSIDILETSRFVLVENYRQAGGGLIEKVLKKQEEVEISKISSKIREKRQGHRGEIFFLTGPDIANSTGIAQEVEKTLFRRGIFVYTARFTPKKQEAYLLAKKSGAVVILVSDKAHRGMESSCSLSNLGDNKIKILTDEILERIA